ncbi:MAG: SDR family oxidoreductase [Actinomycetota bacterium]|nr:SDR family oxidoreductase [Actinomycetota bacterium]
MKTPPLPTESLRGRTALVTGASRGIGAAICARLAQLGARVLLVGRSTDRLNEVAAQLSNRDLKHEVFTADLTLPPDVARLADEVQRRHPVVDILVNNAGVLPEAKRAERISRQQWAAVIELNLTSPWFLACRVRELMPASGGVVINVASTAAMYPSVGLAPYNVSKAGLVMLTQVLALEWASAGIRVLTVAPGKTNTDMVAPIMAWTTKNDIAVNPLGRLGDPAEIADLVGFLCTDRADYLTGAVVPIDGGELLTSGR